MDEPRSEHLDLLQRGIAAAKARHNAEARALLQRALDVNPHSVAAWVWMSGVVDDVIEREACLHRVVALNPNHEAALRGIAVLRPQVTELLLARGQAAREAGDAAEARRLLSEVVVRDEVNLEAWLQLSQVAETAEDREICLENVLALDQENTQAQEGLATLREASAALEVDPWGEIPADLLADVPPAPTLAGEILGADYRKKHTAAPLEPNPWSPDASEVEASEPVTPTLAGAILGETYRQKHTTAVDKPEPARDSAAQALWARYEDPYLCPRCGVTTQPDDRRCPACSQKLWYHVRQRECRSALLWILISIQILNTIALAALPFAAMAMLGLLTTTPELAGVLSAYPGLPDTLSPQTIAVMSGGVRTLIFLVSWLPMLVSAAITVALYVRWRLIYYVMLGSAVLGIASSVAALALAASSPLALISGGFTAAVSVANFALTLKLEGDFLTARRRLAVGLDVGLKTGMDYLLRGRAYAGQGLWTLAAVHYRRAAGLALDQPDGLLGVAQACVHLKDTALARWALQTARSLRPGDEALRSRIDGVLAMLNESDS